MHWWLADGRLILFKGFQKMSESVASIENLADVLEKFELLVPFGKSEGLACTLLLCPQQQLSAP